ncbi:MAG: hypothetical protein COA42_19240 [Alteromonadaceae bacterium]|nr:MAG: hypothetical protein COA42_19240 [Alteromonadaceae bacterium]
MGKVGENMQQSNLATEWCLLQNQFDSYEKYSLLIKLTSIGLLVAAYLANNLSVFVGLLLLLLWLQDAIWKTFQARIDTRLLQLEEYLSAEHKQTAIESKAYQFNRLYLQQRPTNAGLIIEYCQQALRPTVAYPHIVLQLMLGYTLLF